MSGVKSKLTKAGVSVIGGEIKSSDVATAVKVLTASGEWENNAGSKYPHPSGITPYK